jgi:hypothetical protein
VSEALEAARARIGRVETALSILDRHSSGPPAQSDEAPIFVASIGWRSGSTLLQRLLMTDPSVLIWGEPMNRMLLVSHLTEAIAAVDERWPHPGDWIDSRQDPDLIRDWVAVLNPDAAGIRTGMRALLDEWLGAPARARGATRWGAKEVQWSGADGLVLRWLFPNARFLVIVRHPVWSYYSMRNFGPVPIGQGLGARWPERVVAFEEAYGRLWNDLALSWQIAGERLGASLIRYEDLVEGRCDIAGLGASLGLKLDSKVALDARVGGSDYRLLITEDEKTGVNAATVEGRAGYRYAE